MVRPLFKESQWERSTRECKIQTRIPIFSLSDGSHIHVNLEIVSKVKYMLRIFAPQFSEDSKSGDFSCSYDGLQMQMNKTRCWQGAVCQLVDP